jgi:hypothetical protein
MNEIQTDLIETINTLDIAQTEKDDLIQKIKSQDINEELLMLVKTKIDESQIKLQIDFPEETKILDKITQDENAELNQAESNYVTEMDAVNKDLLDLNKSLNKELDEIEIGDIKKSL